MTYIVGLVVAICFCLYVAQLTRNVMWGWVSLLLATWYDLGFGTSSALLGAFHISPLDIVTIPLLLAGAIRFCKRIRTGSTTQTLVLAYLAVFFLSFLRGILAYGVNASGNEVRGNGASLIGLLYFFTIPLDQETIEKFLRYYVYYAIGLFCIGVLAYAGFHVGTIAWTHDHAADERVLPSSAAGAIGLASVILISWIAHRSAKRWMLWAAPLLFSMAILLQTRTVWVMLITMTCAVPFVDWKLLKKLVPMLLAGTFCLVALGIAFYSNSQGLSNHLEESASDTGTLEWRINSWRVLVSDEDQTPETVLIGKSFGSHYFHFDPQGGAYTDAPPHNEYITQYLRVGIVGIIPLFFIILRPFYLLGKIRGTQNRTIFPSASLWSLFAIGAFAFGITYSITSDMWALVGVANALIHARSRRQIQSDNPVMALSPASSMRVLT